MLDEENIPVINSLKINELTKKEDVFDFIKNPKKMQLLIKTNELLNVNKNQHNKLLFVYSSPKVGSTSIVSSLRIFGLDNIDIIHIHDEEMLKVLTKLEGITINEIISYNKSLGKEVYVINVYRSPIERKISSFFEKIGSHHFNANDQDVNTYNVAKVINRFNSIFPWIGNGDHFIDKYDIPIPDEYLSVCADKPAGFPTRASLTDQVEFLKKNGKRYTQADLQNLMTLVRNNNRIQLPRGELFSQLNVIYDLLDSFDSKESIVIDVKFRDNLRAVLSSYDPKVMVVEERKELRNFKNYLAVANERMYYEIVKFFDQYGNLSEALYD